MWLLASSDFLYIRLHGHSQTYSSRYNTTQLQKWAERIKPHPHVWIYFDNDAQCAAIDNAIELQKLTSMPRS
jgi:uncharacterized protein YecE (DUF72 family)